MLKKLLRKTKLEKKTAVKPALVDPKAQDIATLIDALHAQREERRRLNHQLTTLNEQEARTEQDLIIALETQKLSGARGAAAQATISRSIGASVYDWPKLYKWMRRKNRLDLIQRRIAVTAYRELLDEKVQVPGVRPDVLKSIALTTIKR